MHKRVTDEQLVIFIGLQMPDDEYQTPISYDLAMDLYETRNIIHRLNNRLMNCNRKLDSLRLFLDD